MSLRASVSGLYGPLGYTTLAGGGGSAAGVVSGTVVENFSIAGDLVRNEGGSHHVGVAHDREISWRVRALTFVRGRAKEAPCDREAGGLLQVLMVLARQTRQTDAHRAP